MKYLITLFPIFFATLAYSQIDTIVDERDGKKYRTVIIGDKVWFLDHLKYETKRSYCPNFNKKKADCLNGNYYTNTELDSVCPPGWRVSTIEECDAYVSFRLSSKGIPTDSIKYDTLPPPNNSVIVNINNLNLFNDSLLKLAPIGWVEGKKITNKGTLTLWVIDNRSNDDKYHVHIGPKGYVKHTHDHHVIDKVKRVRKFPVRCVCELERK